MSALTARPLGARKNLLIREASGAIAGPPLLLIPGVAGGKELFENILPLLCRDRRVVAVDLDGTRGRGISMIEEATTEVLEILDSLECESVDLLGQSFGSVVAVRVWKHRPDLVRRLILAPPAAPPAGLGAIGYFLSWAAIGTLVRYWPRASDEGLVKCLQRLGGFPPEPDLGPRGIHALRKRVRTTAPLRLIQRMISLMGHSWQRELAGVSAPVLVIEGDREARSMAPDLLRFFRQRESTEVVLVPGRHMPFLAHPDEFVRAVTAHIDRPGSAS